MDCIQNITSDWVYVGANDRRLHLFENIYPIPHGVSYNAYLLKDEKTVLMDTADANVREMFLSNVKAALAGRALDYLVVQHMEPDHCALIEDIVSRYPNVQIVCNAKTASMLGQFFDEDYQERLLLVKEGDTLKTGRHTLNFVFAPMVHWPEVMMTYDEVDKILFSADAFGSFNALDGNLFDDEIDLPAWLGEMRRYYTNIVGKYGTPVQAVLKKAQTLDIQMICPLHGVIWRKELGYILDKYQKWSTYTPEDKSVVLVYASIYGHTEKVVNALAFMLGQNGVKNIRVYDVSSTHPSKIVAEAFRASCLVFASPTYNMGIFPNMETVLLDLKAHALTSRTVALIENGSWAPVAGSAMTKIFEQMKGIKLLTPTVTVKSAFKEAQKESLKAMAQAIIESL